MPLDVVALTALGELAAPDVAPPPMRGLRGWSVPSHLPTRLAAGPARLAALAAGSVVAGAVCGLILPTAATAGAEHAVGQAVGHRAVIAREATWIHPEPSFPRTASVRPVRVAAVAAAVPDVEPSRARRPLVLGPVGPSPYRPHRPLPATSGTGRRIVYAETAAHLWVVAADGAVLRDYDVTGRIGRPHAGSYRVFSKSPVAVNPGEKLRFELMVRFTHGLTGAPIGFHTIPRAYDGTPIQAEKDLGRAIGQGGCVRQSRTDAAWLYRWVHVHDLVVVLH